MHEMMILGIVVTITCGITAIVKAVIASVNLDDVNKWRMLYEAEHAANLLLTDELNTYRKRRKND